MAYLNKYLLFFIILFMLCFYTTNIQAQSISNVSFEAGDSNWQKNNSNIEFNISNEAKQGTQSAQIINNAETSYGIEQIITEIKPQTRYGIDIHIKTNDPPPLKSFLRVAWYESTNGSGSQLKTNDSEIISEVSDWKKISVIAESPEQAHSAKVRLLVSSGQAFFDELWITELPAEIPQPTPSFTTQPSQSISGIYISEVMVYPHVDETEWIEFFNNNDSDVTMTDWYIDDVENGGGSPKLFSLEIPGRSFASFELTSSLFNNSGDEVRLLTNEKTVIDSFTYEKSTQGYSLGKSNDTFCIQIASQNKTNNSCYSNNKSVSPTIVFPTSKPMVLAATIGKQKMTPTPQPTVKKITKMIAVSSITKAITPTPFVEIIDLEQTENSEVNTKPWLLVSGSYSVLAFISLVSKTFIFRYT